MQLKLNLVVKAILVLLSKFLDYQVVSLEQKIQVPASIFEIVDFQKFHIL
jgi:hypothetical protein